MGLFSSKSSSSNYTSTSTENTDKRIATGEGGFVLQTDGSNSTINFEDVNQEVINKSLDLALSFVDTSSGLFQDALNTTNTALANTQGLAQNLFEEKNTPSSDNMKTTIMSIVAGAVLIAYFWRK